MPLPTDPKTQWPPRSWSRIYALYKEHSAWFGGDPDTLAGLYGQRLYGLDVAQFFAAQAGHRPRFWSTDVQNERRTMLHVPVAGDISATSASLLFSEHPKIRIPEADRESPSEAAAATQDWLEDLFENTLFHARLLEAAEACSALGGVFIKVDWDSTLSEYPIFSVVQADQAVPEFRFGILTAVTFWEEVERDDRWVWRHLERHEPGKILHGLYRQRVGATEDQLGEPQSLQAHSATAGLPLSQDTGLAGLACVYVPNMRPNRRFRSSYLGQSDYSGSEGIFDSVDEAYSSLMRDIRLGKGRIIAPESFFEHDPDNPGVMQFDVDKEVYVALHSVANAGAPFSDSISVHQFAIRAAEHLSTIENLLIRAYTNCGYAPQSFGLLIAGSAESGTALRIRERKSFVTSQKKAEYWRPALVELVWIAEQVARIHLGARIVPLKPQVEIQDSVVSNLDDVAKSVQLLRAADAMSIQAAVRTAHPDWNDQQVAEEVARIKEDNAPEPAVDVPGLFDFPQE